MKPGHACAIISVVAKFMVDVGGIEARPSYACKPTSFPRTRPFSDKAYLTLTLTPPLPLPLTLTGCYLKNEVRSMKVNSLTLVSAYINGRTGKGPQPPHPGPHPRPPSPSPSPSPLVPPTASSINMGEWRALTAAVTSFLLDGNATSRKPVRVQVLCSSLASSQPPLATSGKPVRVQVLCSSLASSKPP